MGASVPGEGSGPPERGEGPVLVLGGTGFIGGAIARALVERGHAVRVLARPTSTRAALADYPVEWVEGDLRDAASVGKAARGTRTVVHAAGHYPTTALRPLRTLERGLLEMRNVIAAANGTGARLVYVSSLSTIGRAYGRSADERDRYLPGAVKDPYFEVKHAMEQEALRAKAVVVNPSIVFGPGDVKPTSGRIILRLAQEKLPFAIDGPVNVVDVRDVAAAVVNAIDKGRPGERYILGGENLTLREMFRRIAYDAGVRMPVFVPVDVARAASLATEWSALAGDAASRRLRSHAPALAAMLRRPPLIPLEGVSIIANGQPLDSSKARRELGLASRPLDETLHDTLAWFRDHGYLL